YSARPGTPAADMPRQVPVEKARERNRILRELARDKKTVFMQSLVGKTTSAITLNIYDSDHTEALTDNYLKLQLKGQYPANRWVEVRIQDVHDGALVGSFCLEPTFQD